LINVTNDMPLKTGKFKIVFYVYWLMVLYFIASLCWWYIELNGQNIQMAAHKMADLQKTDIAYPAKVKAIEKEKNGNFYQFIGEGALTLILIMAGAFYLLRQFKNEIKSAARQQSFMTAITHELKTPIAISKLNLETIQRHKLNPAQLERLLYNTLQETNRLDSLCNNLLISRQIDESGYSPVFEDLDFSMLVNECAESFISRYPQRIIKTKIEREIYTQSDKSLMEMVVNNLIDNALKYSPKEKPIEIVVTQKKDNCLLKIIDEGAGIKEEDKIKVFKKYFRLGNEATKTAKGTGLGLFIIKRIAKTHDAKITIESNPKGGSIFIFTQKV
jgi:two-component system, OmpR family, sensor histidine kinase CiaH